MTELESLLILNALGFTNQRVRTLADQFGSGQEVIRMCGSAQTSELILKDVWERIGAFPKDDFLRNEFALMEKHQVRIIAFSDVDYPESLKQIPDAPIVLYAKGNLKTVEPAAIAIVGSRRASVYGITTANQFASRLGELGLTIVSGMARGIDTAAHRGALQAKAQTVAVLGCGLSQIYPPENKKLFDEIADRGIIFSEFPMETLPLAYNFPRRNRIISGLSLGVIVVEAFKRSGALITSRLALEQGREVFALPGNINTPQSQGTNQLIQQGAKLVSCVEDILEEIKPHLERFLEEGKGLKRGLPKPIDENVEKIAFTDSEKMVWAQLGRQPVHLDALAGSSGMPWPQLSSTLFQLALKGKVKELPGKFYVKI